MPRPVKTIAVFFILSLFLSSCEFKCSIGNKPVDAKNDSNAKIKDGAAIYDKIVLNASGGVKVSRANLVNENGERLPEGNFVSLGSKTTMQIVIDSGWTETDGLCYLGASERLTTDAGYEILNNDDIFKDMPGYSPKEAKLISLSVTLPKKENAPPTGFIIYYRVWDKKGPGVIEGQYKVFTK